MKRYTYLELHSFVNRASSSEQVKIARNFLYRQNYLSGPDLESLLETLYQVARKIRTEERLYNPDIWDAPARRFS